MGFPSRIIHALIKTVICHYNPVYLLINMTTDPFEDEPDQPQHLNPERDWYEQISVVFSGLLGIVLAGTFYPLVLSLFIAVISLWKNGFEFSFEMLLLIVWFSLFAGFFGLIFSFFTGLIAIGLTWTMNASLGSPISDRSTATAAGSMAGYIPTCFVLFAPMDWNSQIITIGLLGPFLAMMMGAYGASWSVNLMAHSPEFDMVQQGEIPTRARPQYQLRISHLLIGTAWIALVFAIANATGGFEFAIAAGLWFVFHAILVLLIRIYKKIRSKTSSAKNKNKSQRANPKR